MHVFIFEYIRIAKHTLITHPTSYMFCGKLPDPSIYLGSLGMKMRKYDRFPMEVTQYMTSLAVACSEMRRKVVPVSCIPCTTQCAKHIQDMVQFNPLFIKPTKWR